MAETSEAQSRGHPELAHRIRDDLTWGEEPFELARISDCLVAIGLSCGTMIEMVATKWIQNTPVLAVRSLMTGIPAEIAAELDLRFCDDVDTLKDILRETLQVLRQTAGHPGMEKGTFSYWQYILHEITFHQNVFQRAPSGR